MNKKHQLNQKLKLAAPILLCGCLLQTHQGPVNASTEPTDPIDLYAQITAIQSQMHINIVGLDKIQNEETIKTRGTLEQQITQLLASYNHIVSRTAKGEIERIVIVNKKQKSEKQNIILPTTHRGNHYMVSASLTGDGSLWESMEMIIDTGADIVVLPASMITKLGLSNTQLSSQKMQTANGLTDAKIGTLQALTLGGETINNVQVAFIADKLLGAHRLLGMSALNRYQINIDDQNQSITLIKK